MADITKYESLKNSLRMFGNDIIRSQAVAQIKFCENRIAAAEKRIEWVEKSNKEMGYAPKYKELVRKYQKIS